MKPETSLNRSASQALSFFVNLAMLFKRAISYKLCFHSIDSLKLAHLSPDGAEVKESNNTFWLEVRISKMNFLHIPYFCIGCSLKVFSFYITQDHFWVTDMETALLINISFVSRDFPTSVSQFSQIIHLLLKFEILE